MQKIRPCVDINLAHFWLSLHTKFDILINITINSASDALPEKICETQTVFFYIQNDNNIFDKFLPYNLTSVY